MEWSAKDSDSMCILRSLGSLTSSRRGSLLTGFGLDVCVSLMFGLMFVLSGGRMPVVVEVDQVR